MNKIMCIFGTRPEAIKMCPLIKLLNSNNDIEVIVCSTGQHREMLDQVLNSFDVKTDYDLQVMVESNTLTSMSLSILNKVDMVLHKEQPKLVLVHGDTTTSFVAALAAFYNKIPVGHIEAGLRTYKKYSPYPEEMNRSLISKIAELHFAPTKLNAMNLREEGICKGVYITGNTVIDALKTTISSNYIFHNDVLNKMNFNKNRYILLTVHRRENLGEPIKQIFNAVRELVDENKDIHVIYPVHLNPAVRQYAQNYLKDIQRVHLIEPLDVFDMHNLMKKCYLAMTDSGGLQEEAPSCNVPVVVLRNETERKEAVEAGVAIIAGTKKETIIKIVTELLHDNEKYSGITQLDNPFGDGNASYRIMKLITRWFKSR